MGWYLRSRGKMNCGNWEIQTIGQLPPFLSTINSRRHGAQADREVALYSSQPGEARAGKQAGTLGLEQLSRLCVRRARSGAGQLSGVGACDPAVAKTNLWRFQDRADPTQSHRARLNGAPSSCMGHPPGSEDEPKFWFAIAI